MSEEPVKKKRGPKPKYEYLRPNQGGAPSMTIRLEPDIHEWVKSRPEGPRPYLERVIGEDMKRTQAENGGLLK